MSMHTDSSCHVIAEGLNFPEGPVFDPAGRLWCVELKAGNLVRLDHAGLQRIATGGTPNGLAVDWRGVLWFCDAGQMAIRTYDPAKGDFATVCAEVEGAPLFKPNDLAFDSLGNLLFTCPGDSRTEPTGYVCCLSPDGRVRKIQEGMFFPNGLALCADGTELFVAETYKQRLWKGAWDARSRQWKDATPCSTPLPGAPGPDGMAFDDKGGLYIAVYGAGHVVQLNPDGSIGRTWATPGKNPTNVAFDPSGRLGLVVTEAERGHLLSLPARQTRGSVLYNGETFGR
jgi:sugar lactone lactonase YvrE